MDEKIIEKVDQTIEAVCKYIQNETDNHVDVGGLPEMTNALAALITARANARIEKIG